MDVLLQEMRYAFRSIRNAPLLSAIVVGTLSIGIALTTTFFSLINTAYYHPLPYRKADRIVTVAMYPVLRLPLDELRKMTAALSGITAYENSSAIVSGQGPAVSVSATLIDTAFFRVLGESPVVGSLPTPAEIASREFVVINEKLWRRYFGARPDIVGQSVTIDGELRRVIGVMPYWFSFPERSEMWYPFDRDPGPQDRWLSAIGELAPGKSFADVQSELLLVGARLHAIDSSTYHAGRTGGMLAARDMISRGREIPFYRLLAILVIGGALCVLLVACTNVASLMLARGARRRGEMVIRASLGASQWQLIRQQLVESVILAMIAGIVGTTLSVWGIHLVLGLLSPISVAAIPGWVSLGLDGRVLAFAALASLLTVLVFGLWPAREGTRFDLTGALRGTADHGVTGRDPTRRLHLPVVLELTLSLTLVIGAVTMLQSFRAAAAASRGFAMDDRYRVRVAFDERRDSTPVAYTAYIRALRDNVARADPGSAVALNSMYWTIHGDSAPRDGLRVTGTTRVISWQSLGKLPELVSDNYFRTLDIRVLSGRAFDSTDVETSTLVAVVSRHFANEVWPGENAIGKTLGMTAGVTGRATVVGVVSDVTRQDRNANGQFAPTSEVYLSEHQALTCCNRASFVMHSRLPLTTVSSLVQSQLKAMGRDLPIYVRPLREDASSEGEQIGRILSPILGTFALAGLALALMGIYGVVAFAVERRVREIGVRIALGATQTHIVRHLMKDGLVLIGVGTAAGLVASAAFARLFSMFIVGPVSGHVPAAVVIAVLFGVIALIACYLPARRAAGLDPLVALRSD
jgi:putative ABC transport system permease protein